MVLPYIDCYLMGSDYYETLEEMAYDTERGLPKLGIGDNCFIKNAIVDKNCRIGNNVRINGGSHLPDRIMHYIPLKMVSWL